MTITWCVAHTQVSKELLAKQHLLAQGYEVYLPRFKKICRHARKIEEKLVPLFPRYIFVGMDLNSTRWRRVNGTCGVSHLLMNNATNPAKVPTYVINELRARESDNSIISVTSLVTFTKGEKIRIVDGAFKEQIATFEALGDKARVQLLLSFMGREMAIVLPEHIIEAA